MTKKKLAIAIASMLGTSGGVSTAWADGPRPPLVDINLYGCTVFGGPRWLGPVDGGEAYAGWGYSEGEYQTKFGGHLECLAKGEYLPDGAESWSDFDNQPVRFPLKYDPDIYSADGGAIKYRCNSPYDPGVGDSGECNAYGRDLRDAAESKLAETFGVSYYDVEVYDFHNCEFSAKGMNPPAKLNGPQNYVEESIDCQDID